jgi:hypothetical protein
LGPLLESKGLGLTATPLPYRYDEILPQAIEMSERDPGVVEMAAFIPGKSI